MVVGSFFNRGRDAVYVGEIESAPLMAGEPVSVWPQHVPTAIYERPGAGPGGIGASPGVRVDPHREPHCPRIHLIAEYARPSSRVILLASGLDRSRHSAAGQAVSANGTS